MVTDLVANCRYYLVPGAQLPNGHARDIYEKSYALWKRVWKEVFGQVGLADKLNADDFFRSSIVAAIYHEKEKQVIGLHLYSFFELGTGIVGDLNYFKTIPPDSLKIMARKGYTSVMSMEYLTVAPEWRGSKTGIPMRSLIFGLCKEVLGATGADAGFGTARKDLGLNRAFSELGCYIERGTITKYDYPCELLVVPTDAANNQSAEVKTMVKKLWKSRFDFVGLAGFGAAVKPIKKAA